MGQNQHNLPPSSSARNSRFPLRMCQRKGCDCSFVPQRWNQRYCRDAECRRLLRRWQAAKRQQRRRSRAEVRQQRAAAAKQKRAAARAAGRSAPRPSCSTTPPRPWSRRKKNSAPFCDRPGCYDPPRLTHSCLSRYCGDTCCQAQRRVRDRERKWLRRKTPAGRFKRALEYQVRRVARELQRRSTVPVPAPPDRAAVLDYRERSDSSLSCHDPQEVPAHDPKTSAGTRPRPPPTS